MPSGQLPRILFLPIFSLIHLNMLFSMVPQSPHLEQKHNHFTGMVEWFMEFYTAHRASLVAQMVKNLLAMWEIWVRSLGWEDPLEEGMVIHSSILAWRIPMDRGAWWATVHRVADSDINWAIKHSTRTYCSQCFGQALGVGEGNRRNFLLIWNVTILPKLI